MAYDTTNKAAPLMHMSQHTATEHLKGRNRREEIDEQREAGKTQPRAASNSFPSGEGGSAPQGADGRGLSISKQSRDRLRRPEGDTSP